MVTRWCCAGRWTATRCGWACSACRRRRIGSAGSPITWRELPGSGIIYTLTVAAAHDTAAFLRSRGFQVASYSGQTDDAERQAAEADLLANRVKALVATSALGMGFDKPDLGFVVHLGAPPSPIAYYQQVGRAGRAVEHADVVLLPGQEDRAIWSYFASLAFPPAAEARAVLDTLAEAGKPMSTPALEATVELSRSRLEMMLKVLDVDGAVRRVRGGWESTGAPWTYDDERLARVAAARAAEAQVDDRVRAHRRVPDGVPAARRSTIPAPQRVRALRQLRVGGVPAEVSDAALAAARAHLGQPGVTVAPRKMWPTALGTS